MTHELDEPGDLHVRFEVPDEAVPGTYRMYGWCQGHPGGEGARTLSVTGSDPRPPFGDPEGQSVHDDAIRTLAAAGVTDGCSEGRYCPTDDITRAQFAAMVHRILGLGDQRAGDGRFDDVAPGSIHAAAIAALHATRLHPRRVLPRGSPHEGAGGEPLRSRVGPPLRSPLIRSAALGSTANTPVGRSRRPGSPGIRSGAVHARYARVERLAYPWGRLSVRPGGDGASAPEAALSAAIPGLLRPATGRTSNDQRTGEKHVPTDTIEATTHLRERSSRPLAALTSLAAAALLVVASAVPVLAQDVVVEGADGNVWDPDELEIEVGTEVVFDMTGGDLGHNGVLDGEELFEIIEVGDSTSHVFDQEGEFNLVCTLHPGMEMDIIVGAGADGEAPDDDAADDAAEDDAAAEDEAEEADDAAAEDDAELAAAEGEDGGGDTVLLLAVLTALALMLGSFALIRREST